MSTIENFLSPADKAKMKRKIIESGQTCSGMTHAEIQAKYNSITGQTLHSQSPVIDEAPAKPAPKKRKPKAATTPKPKPKPEAAPINPPTPTTPTTPTAQDLMAVFEQALNGNQQASAMSEERIIELIKQHAPKPKMVTITITKDQHDRIYWERLDLLETLKSDLDPENEYDVSDLIDNLRQDLDRLDKSFNPIHH